MEMEKYIDHTILRPDATIKEIDQVIEEAKAYHFASVCINPYWVSYVKEKLAASDVKVCTVIGFPLGATPSKVKAFETITAIEDGADEVDMVINIGALKDGQFQIVQNDIEEVVRASQGKLVKVIIETCLLSDDEKRMACELAKKAGADFVKTSTGFSNGGATIDDVILMKSVVGDALKVKASGGIRDQKTALAMINAGADRIGTSSSIKIVKK